jgi:hypothetical protein
VVWKSYCCLATVALLRILLLGSAAARNQLPIWRAGGGGLGEKKENQRRPGGR